MDFFTSQHDNQSGHVDDVDSFAKAIANRYENHTLTNTITAKLEQPPFLAQPSPSLALHPPSPARKPRSGAVTGQEFTCITPDSLEQYLGDPLCFLVDIRPHAHHVSARLPDALSLSVPSTLLKRPLFSLDKLAAMIGNASSQARFARWREAKAIIVYDSDTQSLVEGNNVLGLLRKFANDTSTGTKYTGTIAWLQGGFAAVWKTKRQLVDSKPLEDSPEPESQPPIPYLKAPGQGSPMKLSGPSSTGPPSASSLSARRKAPGVALSLAGSGSNSSTSSLPASNLALPPSGFNLSMRNKPSSQGGSSGGSSQGKNKNNSSLSLAPSNLASQSTGPINPFFDTIRQNTELSQGITEKIPLRLARRVKRRIDDLPFDWLKDIARGAGSIDVTDDQSSASSDSTDSENASGDRKGTRTRSFATSSSLGSRAPASSSGKHRHKDDPNLPKESPSAVEEGMENLAMQFYRIELAEQRRLMNIMQHHSNESDSSNLARTQAENVLAGQAKGSQEGSDTGESVPSSMKRAGSNSGSGSGSGSSKTTAFPYSITAGVEKGAKNRYRHIWPFEHARVKIHTKHQRTDSYMEEKRLKSEQNMAMSQQQSDDAAKPATTLATAASAAPVSAVANPGQGDSFAKTPTAGTAATTPSSESSELSDVEGAAATWTDDYVNASFVQPLCTRKRYIATQGPLEATFNDFWTLVWQQNVHVIVMLTREVEGSMIKCHRYWTDDVKYFEYAAPHTPPIPADNTPVPLAPYGSSSRKAHLKLELISSEGEDRPGGDTRMSYFNSGASSGFFDVPRDSPSAAPPKAPTPIIKRVFRLTHEGYRDAKPRTIIHFQYLEWPDMNVPDDPRGVLKLVKEVEQAVAISTYPEEDTDDGGAESVTGSGGGSAKASVSGSGSGKASGKRAGSGKASSGKASSNKTVRTLGRKHKKILDRENGVVQSSLGRQVAPVLLHCSAGVGRTGGFIAIDATLDGIRSELRKNLQKEYYGEEVRKDADGDVVMKNIEGPMDTQPSVSGVALEAVVVPANKKETEESRPGPSPVVSPKTHPDNAKGAKTRTIGISVSQVGDLVHVPVVPREHPAGEANEADQAPKKERRPKDQEQMLVDEEDENNIRQNADFFHDGKAHTMAEDKVKEGLATKRWAENVGDETGANFGTATNPEDLGPRGASVDNTRASSVARTQMPGRRRAASTSTSTVDVTMSEPTEVKATSLPTKPTIGRDVSMLDITQRTASPSGFLFSDESGSRLRTSSSPTPPSLTDIGTTGFIGSSPLTKPPANRSKPSLDRNMTVRPRPPSQESNASESDNSQSAEARESSLSLSSGDMLSVANAPPSTAATDREANQDSSGLGSLSGQDDSAVDDTNKLEYNLPRALHSEQSPQLLSSYEEPMWEVVQDMREQRMSLCQSLRQYVFVHAAVVEGALDIADEERSRAARRARRRKNIVGQSSDMSSSNESMLSVTSGSSKNLSASNSSGFPGADPSNKQDTPMTSASSMQAGMSTNVDVTSRPVKSAGSTRKPPKLYLYTSDSSASASGSGQSTGKRVASPTELIREDKSGGVALSKRPSIKRKMESDSTPARMPHPNTRTHKRSSSNLAPPPP